MAKNFAKMSRGEINAALKVYEEELDSIKHRRGSGGRREELNQLMAKAQERIRQLDEEERRQTQTRRPWWLTQCLETKARAERDIALLQRRLDFFMDDEDRREDINDAIARFRDQIRRIDEEIAERSPSGAPTAPQPARTSMTSSGSGHRFVDRPEPAQRRQEQRYSRQWTRQDEEALERLRKEGVKRVLPPKA